MGAMTKGAGSLATALVVALPDADGRRWAMAHLGAVSYVAWSGPADHAVYRIGGGTGLLGEALDEAPVGLAWEPLEVPVAARRAAR